MAGLGVLPHVVEKILNHTSGIVSGIAAVYNLFQYQAERREALGKWGDFLDGLGECTAKKSMDKRGCGC